MGPLAPLLLPLLLLPPPQLSELSMPLPIPQLSPPPLLLMLLPQLLMLLPQLLMLLMLLPQLLMLLPLLLMPLLPLLPLLLAQSALSSRLRMSSATLLTDTRTSTLPSKNREMPMEVSPDLTLMLMRLESTLSTMLLMIWDSEFPEITSQLPPSTTLPSQLPQCTLLPQLLTPQRSWRLRLLSSLLSRLRLPEPRGLLSLVLSAHQLMLVLPLAFSQLAQLLLLPMLPLLPLPLPVKPSSPPSS